MAFFLNFLKKKWSFVVGSAGIDNNGSFSGIQIGLGRFIERIDFDGQFFEVALLHLLLGLWRGNLLTRNGEEASMRLLCSNFLLRREKELLVGAHLVRILLLTKIILLDRRMGYLQLARLVKWLDRRGTAV